MSDLTALRRAIAALEPSSAPEADDLFRLGADEVDAPLGGGLRRGALHEAFARNAGDAASVAGFGFGLALRAAGGRPLVWARQDFVEIETGALHGEGLAAFGCDPRDVLVVRPRDALGVLRAAGEAARCPAIGAVVAEIWSAPGAFDLKASRRLALAAEKSGVTLVSIRRDAPGPSAAQSRWRVAAAASTPLEADAPGLAAFDIELLRHRAGLPPRAWRLEWDRDSQSFASLSRTVAPLPADRPAEAAGATQWRRAG